jgi:hypothetical protein
MRVHDAQCDQLKRYESNGWKSPYQSEADAVDQAHRLADGYNRQFLRVLRQLRDLRRYAPVVIQNAQQVNVRNQQLKCCKVAVDPVPKQRTIPRKNRDECQEFRIMAILVFV